MVDVPTTMISRVSESPDDVFFILDYVELSFPKFPDISKPEDIDWDSFYLKMFVGTSFLNIDILFTTFDYMFVERILARSRTMVPLDSVCCPAKEGS